MTDAPSDEVAGTTAAVPAVEPAGDEPTDSAVAAPTATAEPLSANPSATPPFTHTRASGNWAAVVIGLLITLVLIVFILDNLQRVKVSFFGAHGNLPEGVALLLAAVIGGLIVVLAGAARILQLRSRARKSGRATKPRRRGLSRPRGQAS